MSEKSIQKSDLNINSDGEEKLIRQALGEPLQREKILEVIQSEETSNEIFRSFSDTDRERVLA